jgi:hypothetical protein
MLQEDPPTFSMHQCFFLHFCKVACGATSALHVVLNWLTFRFVGSFFFGTTPKLLISKWLPHSCEGEISGPSFRFKKSGYLSNQIRVFWLLCYYIWNILGNE